MATTLQAIERIPTHPRLATTRVSSLSGDLYRYHGMRVFDREGERLGIVDWIWSNARSDGGYIIGLQLQWLRGKARAVPAHDVIVDRDRGIVMLPYTRRRIESARRYRIDRFLSDAQRAAINSHFTGSAAPTGAMPMAKRAAA